MNSTPFSFRNRYTSRGFRALRRWTTVSALNSTSWVFQKVQSCHHLVEARAPGTIDTIAIMQLARTVDAEADKEVLFLEKTGPTRRQAGFHWSARRCE